MIKAVIIEDESGARKVLRSLLEEYVSQVSIVGEGASVEEGVKVIQNKKPDLIFLDINLPDGDGFEILEKCKNEDFEVIFTTAYGEYREKAFDYFALQYLTKPLDVEKLEEAIKKYESRNGNSYDYEKYELLKHMMASNIRKIAIPIRDGYALVDIKDIIRCEAKSNYSEIFLKDGKNYLTAKSLKYYDELLTEFGFYRIHKSHLVNTNFIKEVKQEGTVLMEDGSLLSISQRAKRDFMKYLEKLT